MSTRLNQVVDPGAGNPLPDSYTKDVADDINYLVVPGADVASAGSINIAARFHRLTGTTTVHDVTDPSGAVAGQRVELFLKDGSVTFQNNGGGTGNIRTSTGADMTFSQNQIVVLEYDSANTVWRIQNAGGNVTYRIGATAVNGTVAETDLTAGALSIGAGALLSNGVLKYLFEGDWLNNVASTGKPPRIKLILGSTTLFDTGASGLQGISASRMPWRIVGEIKNVAATNVQECTISMYWGFAHTSSGITGRGAWSTGVASWANIGGAGTTLDEMQTTIARNTAAVDTTVANLLKLTATNDQNSGSYETKLIHGLVEVVNP